MSRKLLAGILETITTNAERLTDEELNKLALLCDRLNGNRPADGSLQSKRLLMARVLNARIDFKPINSLSLIESTEHEKGKRTA